MATIKISSLLFFSLLVFATTAQSMVTESYTYDDAGRLTKVSYGNGTSISYDYDPAGNLLSEIKEGIESSTDNINDSDLTLQIKPNPVDGHFDINVSLRHEAYGVVSLHNAIGTEVMLIYEGNIGLKNSTLHVNSKELSNGIYFCRLVAGDQILNKKVIVTH